MARWIWIFAALAAVLLSAGCEPILAGRGTLFPQAAYATVIGAPDAEVFTMEPDGRASAFKFLPNGKPGPARVREGGRLSATELAQLRKAVRIDAPEQAMAACCSPRHAFLFYDRAGRLLGFLRVCFECGCADITPQKASSGDIVWDHEALGRIVTAHGLAPLVPPPPQTS